MFTKSFAKTFSLPLNSNELHNQQIQKVLIELMQQQDQYIFQKLKQNQQTQTKIKKIENQFTQWADKKYLKFKTKLQKSEQNRNQIIQKIVKRYKDKDKVHNEKIKNVLTKRKLDLRQAWRAANKFNQKILSKSFHQPFQKNPEQQKIQQNQDSKIGEHANQEIISMRNTVKSQFLSKSLQKSKDRVLNNQIKKSLEGNFKYSLSRKEEQSKTHTIQQDEICQEDCNPQVQFEDKMRINLLRHIQHTSEEQNKRIQQLGKRLRKIQLSRIKKQSLNKKKMKKNDHQMSLSQSRDRENNKQQKKTIQRLKSEPVCCDNKKRSSDWSQLNKRRREQLFMSHIQNGNHYLKQNKIRYLKEILSKNSTYNAVEKKLYIERLSH